MKRISSRIIAKLRRKLSIDSEIERLLIGRLACDQMRKKQKIDDLSEVEFRVFSQWGEDGIIDWLIHKLELHFSTFVEFGVENYTEANTRFLLQNRNWSGLVLDGDRYNIEEIRGDWISWRHDLHSQCVFIDAENINGIMRANGIEGSIGLLSVDVDGMDYWILKAIDIISPIIIVCEYNALFGDIFPLTVPYNPRFSRSDAHYSMVYYGTSIGALTNLAEEKGYTLVGSTSIGSNAFFVRNDYIDKLNGVIAHRKAKPCRFREARDQSGSLNFSSASDRLKAIGSLPVVDVKTGTVVPISSLGNLWSPTWETGMGLEVGPR